MLYCDAATFCRRRNDAGIMTDETGRRCAQESIDIIIMKNKYYYLFIKNNFDYLLNKSTRYRRIIQAVMTNELSIGKNKEKILKIYLFIFIY